MNILQYYFPCLRNNNYWNTSTEPNNKLLQYIVFEYICIYLYPNIFFPTTGLLCPPTFLYCSYAFLLSIEQHAIGRSRN